MISSPLQSAAVLRPAIIERRDDTKIYIAVDTSDFNLAKSLVDPLRHSNVGFKLGMEFFMAHGQAGVKELLGDAPLFLDLKFHDIPNTVAGAIRSVAPLGANLLNVHASGGAPMMRAAKNALDASDCGQNTKLIGVTVLTSMDQTDLQAVGQSEDPAQQVLRLAKLAFEAGLDGVVCSAHEAAKVREAVGDTFLAVTPGMRATSQTDGQGDAGMHDQKRAMTPTEALRQGSTHLVIGRLVTQATDPVQAVETLLADLDLA